MDLDTTIPDDGLQDFMREDMERLHEDYASGMNRDMTALPSPSDIADALVTIDWHAVGTMGIVAFHVLVLLLILVLRYYQKDIHIAVLMLCLTPLPLGFAYIEEFMHDNQEKFLLPHERASPRSILVTSLLMWSGPILANMIIGVVLAMTLVCEVGAKALVARKQAKERAEQEAKMRQEKQKNEKKGPDALPTSDPLAKKNL